jgi:hypothetical protein
MKKFIQISLVVVLIFMFLQVTTYGSMTVAGQLGSTVDQNISITANTSVQDVQGATCLGAKRVICIKPEVGWNS